MSVLINNLISFWGSNCQVPEGETNPLDAPNFYSRYDLKKVALLEEELLEVKRHPELLQQYTPAGNVGEEQQIIYMDEEVGEISPRDLESEGVIREGYVENSELKRRPSTSKPDPDLRLRLMTFCTAAAAAAAVYIETAAIFLNF